MELFRLFGRIFVDDNNANRQIQNIDNQARRTSGTFENMGRSASGLGSVMKSAFSFAGGMAIFQGVTEGIKASIGAGWEFNKSIEDTMSNFTTMLGSASEAQKMLADIKDFAAKTPFELTDLAKGTQTLLAFGTESEKIMPTLKMLGDVSLGNSEKFSSLAVVFGQIQSTGRLMGGDLLQLINNGFNPLQVISQQTGESMLQLKDKMEKGGISADMVTKAFESATAKGGQFYNSMDNASKTFSGQMSTLKDNIATTFGAVLEPLFNNASGNIIPKLNTAFTNLGNWIRENMPIIQADISSAFSGSGKVIEWLSVNVLPTLQEIFKVFMDYIKNYVLPTWTQIFNFLSDVIIPKLADAFSTWFPKIKEIIENLWIIIKIILDQMKLNFETVFPYIKNVVIIAFDGIKIAVNLLLGVLGGLIKFITGVFSGDWSKAWQGVKDIFKSVFDAITTIFSSQIEWLTSKIEWVLSKISSLKNTISSVSSYLTGATSIISGKRASGGSVQANKTYLVGERGPELFTSNQSGTIIPNNKLSGGGNTIINVNVSGNSLMNPSDGDILGDMIVGRLKLLGVT
ncbi:MAG: hypothetical protein RLZZ577_107 [Bacteroidota bacterium]|jgi:tape measure domain-containing protein